jgi:hypothetical protein
MKRFILAQYAVRIYMQAGLQVYGVWCMVYRYVCISAYVYMKIGNVDVLFNVVSGT